MIINKNQKGENMITNVAMVLLNIWTAVISIFATIWGKILIFALFLGSIFGTIAGLIHIVLILTTVDMIFGVLVTLKTKGKDEIVSSKLRNSLYKGFFYIMFISLTFLVELQMMDVCIGPKVAFAVIAAVEMWSISANALILSPDFPFLKLFKRFLTAEISKKLEINKEEVEDILNKKSEEDKNKESFGSE